MVEWANVHNAWMGSRVTSEVKTEIDAVTRAHGQPIAFLTADWASLFLQFRVWLGVSIRDGKLPSQM